MEFSFTTKQPIFDSWRRTSNANNEKDARFSCFILYEPHSCYYNVNCYKTKRWKLWNFSSIRISGLVSNAHSKYNNYSVINFKIHRSLKPQSKCTLTISVYQSYLSIRGRCTAFWDCIYSDADVWIQYCCRSFPRQTSVLKNVCKQSLI